jgi:hypothetical protein
LKDRVFAGERPPAEIGIDVLIVAEDRERAVDRAWDIALLVIDSTYEIDWEDCLVLGPAPDPGEAPRLQIEEV